MDDLPKKNARGRRRHRELTPAEIEEHVDGSQLDLSKLTLAQRERLGMAYARLAQLRAEKEQQSGGQ